MPTNIRRVKNGVSTYIDKINADLNSKYKQALDNYFGSVKFNNEFFLNLQGDALQHYKNLKGKFASITEDDILNKKYVLEAIKKNKKPGIVLKNGMKYYF